MRLIPLEMRSHLSSALYQSNNAITAEIKVITTQRYIVKKKCNRAAVMTLVCRQGSRVLTQTVTAVFKSQISI